MKILKIKGDNRKIKGEEEIVEFQNRLGIVFPEEVKDLILNYEGCRLEDSQKYFKTNTSVYEVNQMLFLERDDFAASIEAILEGHKFYGIEDFIPFAIDSGGWDYNVSIKAETYGQIWFNKFDSDEENPLSFVATTLEEFIDGLKSEEEI